MISLRNSPIYRKKSFDESKHPRDEGGKFGEGSVGAGKPESKLPRATKSKGPKPDDPVHGYLDAFNDPGETPATADDARTANKELKEEGSKYRVIPDGEGKWKTAHVKDLVNEYGESWMVGVNALTGKVDLAGRDYLKEMQTLSGDKISRGYLAAFNDMSGGQATPEEAATANEEMAADGSKFQIAFDKDYGLWVAKPGNKLPSKKADDLEQSMKGGNPKVKKIPFPVDEDPPYLGGKRPTDAEVSSVPITKVKTAGLIATQATVNSDVVNKASDEPVLIVRYDGKEYIDDGSHRATARKLAGDETINARVFEVDPKTKEWKPVGSSGKPANNLPK